MADGPSGREQSPSRGQRFRRWLGLVRLSVGRFAAQLRRTPRRTAVTVTLVALTVALLVIVTGISLGLATDSATDEEVDARVVPAGGGTLSAVIDVEGARLGDVHERTARIDQRDDIAYATPLLTEVVRIRTADGETETVLAMGVVPPEEPATVEGVSTASLEPGDPHFANGSVDGPRTGEIVLTDAVADDLNASTGDELAVRSPLAGGEVRTTVTANRTAATRSLDYTATAVDDGAAADVSSRLPIVVLHLSELQSMTGAADGDLADQVLVEAASDASPAAAEAAATAAYPNATVQTGGEQGITALRTDDLALATSLVALVVALVVCSLFVATSAALTIDRDRELIAVLAAAGFSGRSRLAVVAVTTLSQTVAGALVGLGLGLGGVALTNHVAAATVTSGPIAALRPAVVPYALGVALIAGLLAMPYPLYLAARTNVVTELGR